MLSQLTPPYIKQRLFPKPGMTWPARASMIWCVVEVLGFGARQVAEQETVGEEHLKHRVVA